MLPDGVVRKRNLGSEARLMGLGFELLRGHWWPFLLASLLLALLGVWGLAARMRDRKRMVSPNMLARFQPGFSINRARARVALAAAAALLLATAALGPVRGYTKRRALQRGVDIVLCLDTSRSMLARDVRPSRLERAKREIIGLFNASRGDRMALVAFSGDARDIAPLTHDRSTLEALLADVGPADNRIGGTDLGAALERALSLFDGRTGAHEAVVLLTDGEDLEGRGAEIAAQASELGIRIYVVGIGTALGGKIPVQRNDGSEGFLANKAGREVVTQLDGTTLEALARATDGLYLSSEQSPTPLEDLYRTRITRLDKRELQGGLELVPHDRFQWPLVLAFVCMLLELGMRERRPMPRSAKSGS